MRIPVASSFGGFGSRALALGSFLVLLGCAFGFGLVLVRLGCGALNPKPLNPKPQTGYRVSQCVMRITK